MDAKRKESMSIMKKIMIAMVTGILLGVVCLWLRESLTAGGNEGTWKLINRIFFQDITQEKGFYSLGLFYIIQQLFMRGLQLAIVPLVLSSLSLALCSMADPKRLGKIAGKTIGTFVGFYVCGAIKCCGSTWFKQQHSGSCSSSCDLRAFNECSGRQSSNH